MPAARTTRSREVVDLSLAELRELRDDAGAGRRTAPRQGSPEGQPDAEPREHVEPHVASGAAGDLLRPPLHARRDARAASKPSRPTTCSAWRRICSATAAWPRPSWDRRRDAPLDGGAAEDLAIHDSALHASGDGRHLERRAPVRDLAGGRAGRDRRAGGRRRRAGGRRARRCASAPPSTSRASRRSSRPRSTT